MLPVIVRSAETIDIVDVSSDIECNTGSVGNDIP